MLTTLPARSEVERFSLRVLQLPQPRVRGVDLALAEEARADEDFFHDRGLQLTLVTNDPATRARTHHCYRRGRHGVRRNPIRTRHDGALGHRVDGLFDIIIAGRRFVGWRTDHASLL